MPTPRWPAPLRTPWLAVWLLLVGCSSSERPPDVLLLVVDTLRADHLSCYGYRRATSPALDAWAQGGTLFERAYAPASWTLPSMAMLMTGQLRSDNSGDLGPLEITLAERLRDAGYATQAVVSNPLLDAQKGYTRGFDGYQLVPVGKQRSLNGWSAGEVVERGLAALDGVASDRPWFLFLMLFDPHDPYEPEGGARFEPFDEPERRQAFAAALPAAERSLLTEADYRGIEARIALYDSEIRVVDGALERLFGQLALAGPQREPLVALTSDHGEGLWQRARLAGEQDEPEAFFPALYMEHGVMLYEEQIHVPLILRGPGVPAGRRIAAPASILDLAATFEARLGLEPLAPLAGRDLLDFVALEAPRDLVAFTSRGSSLLVEGRYKLHEPRDYRIERFGARPEWYDLALDPLERLDRFAEAERGDLRSRLGGLRASAARQGPRNAVEPALLEALGYLPDLIDGQAPAAEPQDGPAPGSAPADRPQGSGGQD
jgi:arylsulfatase